MTPLSHNSQARWAVRGLLIVLGVAIIAGFGFLQGMFYANRRATVQLANNGCFDAWSGLMALNDPVNRRLATLLDREMDSCGAKLAEMSLRYPSLIERRHYNVLIRVRDYRKKFGRGSEPTPPLNAGEVDTQIAKAIAYLESIHDTNEWRPFKIRIDDGLLQSKPGR
jgi:hypothetical protein